MGANHPGEIQLLCKIAGPTHGVVTNIGKAHLEGFDGIEGVKRAKSELYESLSQSGGVAFVNMNEAFLSELSATVPKRIFYGIHDKAVFTSARYQFEAEQSSFGYTIGFVDADNLEWKVNSALFGAFNVANIATAVAVGLYFKVPGDQICNAIAGYIPNNNRAQRTEIGSNTFILDAYNANPTSMSSAIESFASILHPNKLMILGAMMELGEYAMPEHFEIARLASTVANTTTIFVGNLFREPAEKLHQQWYSDVEALTRAISQHLPQNALILVKGSRSLHLESLLAGFQ
jgi:UDP-N-acetylmuramoyl-tripeptide--D-alanyl-D-alanine ligase